jgi:hypothetical protein
MPLHGGKRLNGGRLAPAPGTDRPQTTHQLDQLQRRRLA